MAQLVAHEVLQPVESRTVDRVEVRGERRCHVEELEGDQDVETDRCP